MTITFTIATTSAVMTTLDERSKSTLSLRRAGGSTSATFLRRKAGASFSLAVIRFLNGSYPGQRIRWPKVAERWWLTAACGLADPDIDAVTRLAAPVMATGYKRGESFALAKGTWFPFNSQNTALAREAIPAYFLSPHVGRYDDIWASYVVKSVAVHMQALVSPGSTSPGVNGIL